MSTINYKQKQVEDAMLAVLLNPHDAIKGQEFVRIIRKNLKHGCGLLYDEVDEAINRAYYRCALEKGKEDEQRTN